MVVYKKALFVHVPKTGGSWVTEVLKRGGGKDFAYSHDIPQHHRAYIFLRRLQPFCFVRHPLLIVCSLWKHWSGNPQCRVNNADEKLYKMWDKKAYGRILCDCIDERDVNRTIENFLTRQPLFITELLHKYTGHCEHVGRHENLRSDLISIIEKINGEMPESLRELILFEEPVNVSMGKDMSLDRRLVERFVKEETVCSEFGYGIADLEEAGLV